MAKHEAYELKQMQSLPLKYKILMSQQRIQDWYEYWNGEVYISFSGGVNSTVLLYLVRELYPDVVAVFCDTGLEYPEIREFVKTFDNVVWLKPKKNFKQIIKEKGYPVLSKNISHNVGIAKRNPEGNVMTNLFNPDKKGKYAFARYRFLIDAPFNVSDVCCNYLKKEPAHRYSKETGKKAILGIMAEESEMRKDQWMKHGCNAFDLKHPQSSPLSFWTQNDMLQYLYETKKPYCSVYGDIVIDETKTDEMLGQISFDERTLPLTTTGCKRTGCMYCLFGIHREKSPNRLEQMKITHPKTYGYIMKSELEGGLNYKFVIDWLNEHGNLNIKY